MDTCRENFKEETMHDRFNEALHKVKTLNGISNIIFEMIPKFIENRDLDDIEQCLDILQKIDSAKRTLEIPPYV